MDSAASPPLSSATALSSSSPFTLSPLSFRSSSLRFEVSAAELSAGQSLASVLNNPHHGKGGAIDLNASWSAWFGGAGAGEGALADTIPPVPPGTLAEISRSDFDAYLSAISDKYGRFLEVRDHLLASEQEAAAAAGGEGGGGGGREVGGQGEGGAEGEKAAHGSSKRSKGAMTASPATSVGAGAGGGGGGVGGGGGGGGGTRKEKEKLQGEGLVVCLREIPPLYFDEDFALENPSVFQAACPVASLPANLMLQEKLSHYLDLVEAQLVKEISARSDSFFEALGQLEDLNGKMVLACGQIKSLRTVVELLDGDLIESARQIQAHYVRRNNLLHLLQKLKLVSSVYQAQVTLRLLMASEDCAGALDVIDDLKRLLEGDELVGLHCFRYLGEQLTTSLEAVNGMLAADFVRVAVHSNSDLETAAIIANFGPRAQQPAHNNEDDTGNGILARLDEGKVFSDNEEEEEAGLREELLPFVIGLLRTAKLPAVLRSYRESLITDIKAAIKCVVGELLPLLFSKADNMVDGEAAVDKSSADADVGVSLASKLRSLLPEAFMHLLSAVFAIVQARLARAAKVRMVIEHIIDGLGDSYVAEAVAAAVASGAATAAAAEAASTNKAASIKSGLVSTGPDSASGKSMGMENALAKSGAFSSSGAGAGNAAITVASTSRQFRADVLRENTEAVCAACDAAHGRWAKLLGVRALVHPKLRLHEFVEVYTETQQFIAETEKIGGRIGYSIRGSLQSQCKAFIDTQHAGKMSKITALLEQETWVAVDAPPEFQVIVDILVDGLITRGTGTDFGGHGSGISAVNGIDTSLDGSLDATLLPHQGSSNAKGGEQTGNGVAVPDPSKERDDDGGRHERRATVGEEGPAEKSQPSDAAATSEDPPRAAAESQRAEPSGGDAEAAKASEVGEAGPSGAPGPSPENVKRETGDGVDSARSGGASSELREGRSSADSTTGSNGSSTASSVAVGKGKKVKEKQSIRTLVVRESKFHVVGSALILLKMIAEYVDIANFLPALATEVVHRVAEILKFFNSRTCQLVLGAGAMQVSGLKSITAKHLALSSQCISFLMAILPDVRRALAFHIPEARKALLLTEVDRVGQDYRVHRDEIHSKLVQIMRERLQVHLRTLPAQVEGWNNPDNGDTQPSQFARNLTKEVGVLHRVLSPLLLESDIRSIFRRVVAMFHFQLSDAYSKVDVSTPQANRRLYRDVHFIIQNIKGLPSETDGESGGQAKLQELEEFLVQRFGNEPPP